MAKLVWMNIKRFSVCMKIFWYYPVLKNLSKVFTKTNKQKIKPKNVGKMLNIFFWEQSINLTCFLRITLEVFKKICGNGSWEDVSVSLIKADVLCMAFYCADESTGGHSTQSHIIMVLKKVLETLEILWCWLWKNYTFTQYCCACWICCSFDDRSQAVFWILYFNNTCAHRHFIL